MWPVPDIVSRGFVYVRESETLMEDCRITCQEALDRCLSRGVTDWGKIKSVIKDDMGEFLWKTNQEKPDDPSDNHRSVEG